MAGFIAKPPKGATLRRGHKLAKGLIGAWLFNEKTGPLVEDSATGKTHRGTTAATASWTTGPHGAALSLNGSSQYVAATGFKRTLTQATFAALVYLNGAQSAYAGVVFSRGTNVIGLSLSNAGTKLAYTWNDNSSTYDWGGGPTLVTGKWIVVGVSIVPATGTAFLYDTEADTLATASLSFSHTSNVMDDLRLGDDEINAFPGTRYINGAMGGAWIWDRGIPLADIRTFCDDPFAMFRRRNVAVLKAVAATGNRRRRVICGAAA